MSTPPKPQQDNRHIFIDTCIIQFSGDKNKSKSEAVTKCLASLAAEGYLLAISEITLYENLHGLWGQQVEKAYELINSYESKVVSWKVLLFASMLGGLYHEEKRTDVDMGDKIIAATALLERGLVLTANHKDYPTPFFLTEKSFALTYKVGHYTKTLDLILYKPDSKLILRRINERAPNNS